MKKIIAIIASLWFASLTASSCTNQIKAFYAAYMNNMLQDESKNVALCRIYFTEELIEKVERLGNATGVNPIIRAQDMTADAVETLSVKDLGDGWYMVAYLWKRGEDDSLTEIPVKAQNIDGRCRITYITPVWNGTRYGDELLVHRGESIKTDQTSAYAFLCSFYNAYTFEYCLMAKDLGVRLSSMRAQHLSPNAMEQFRNAESDNMLDGLSGYDLLIDNFDFDCMWCNSIEITHLNDNNYQMTYRSGDKEHKIVVALTKNEGGYLIDRIIV